MKLVVFTPVNHRSAIARVAAMVTRELTGLGHEVVVVGTESSNLTGADTHEFGKVLLWWRDHENVSKAVQHADSLVFHIGNNFDYHEGALCWLDVRPGVVCLHDVFLGHLFLGWAHLEPVRARALLAGWYGKERAEWYFASAADGSLVDGTHALMPLTEWVCAKATAVLTHSRWAAEKAAESCPGPIAVAALPYPGAEGRPVPGSLGERHRVITIGDVNANKRVESVIRAIGRSATLKTRVTYELVGRIAPAEVARLTTMALDAGVDLVVSGEVSDEALAEAMQRADIISCLRIPCLEAASASAIEAMLSGRPLIVVNDGFYREIPDDCAIKIDAANELNDLQTALERLQADSGLRVSVAARAYEWAQATFNATSYAQRLAQISAEASTTRPVVSTIDHFAKVLGEWGGHAGMLAAPEISGPLKILSGASAVDRRAERAADNGAE
jgi:glycosyltransferase involved in cell wall biosynthesis